MIKNMFSAFRFPVVAFISAAAISAPGCRGDAPTLAHQQRLEGTGISRMGFSVQVGAFKHPDNATALVEALSRTGLDAYYFAHGDGFFKVRFGNFASGEDALKKARELSERGMISDYFIVRPQDYPSAAADRGSSSSLRESIAETAKSFIGIPYRWSGTSADEGFDCSGLTSTVYKLNGLDLPRTAEMQLNTGTPVSGNVPAKGDLVFFTIPGEEKTLHVGISLGDGRFVHAPGKGRTVEIENLSNPFFRQSYLGARTYI